MNISIVGWGGGGGEEKKDFWDLIGYIYIQISRNIIFIVHP